MKYSKNDKISLALIIIGFFAIVIPMFLITLKLPIGVMVYMQLMGVIEIICGFMIS